MGWAARAEVLYAKAGAARSGDCRAWGSACTLDEALEAADVGDEVWVQAGTYGPIVLVDGVKVLGGFAGTETDASQSDPAANPTVIDGGGSARAVVSRDNGSTTVLRGFRITKGYDAGTDGGGGLLLHNSSARIVGCAFDHNSAKLWGGGVAVLGGGSPVFVGCVFHDNGQRDEVATVAGGAVYLDGGSPTFVNCLFHGNRAGEGGVLALREGSPKFINCTLVGNSATAGGGGAIHDSIGRTRIHNSIVWANTAASAGAQIFNGDRPSVVRFSDVEGGHTGTGNIDVDPQFEDMSSRDYRLRSSSPCRNAGRNDYLRERAALNSADPNGDLAGTSRINESIVDLGALEWVE
jgi:hypothetical protein